MPNTTFRAAAEGLPAALVDPDDFLPGSRQDALAADAANGAPLLEMPYVRDGKRDTQLDRIAALVWIARDHCERIGKGIDDNFHAIGSGEAQ